MIGLVACSKTKLAHAAPARDLYCSELFRKSLAAALADCEVVYVVSALHGLVPLDRVVEPYEQSVRALKQRERELWGQRVVRELVDRYSNIGYAPLCIYAGAEYVKPIRAALRCADTGFVIVEPLAGMQVGQRLSFLKLHAANRKAA